MTTPAKKKAAKEEKTVEEEIVDADVAAAEVAKEIEKEEEVNEDEVVGQIIDGRWVVDIENIGQIGFRHLTRKESKEADLRFTMRVHALKRDGIPSISDMKSDLNVEQADIDTLIEGVSDGDEPEKVAEKILGGLDLQAHMRKIGISAEKIAADDRVDYWMFCSTEVMNENGDWEKKWKTTEDLDNERGEVFEEIFVMYDRFKNKPMGFTLGSLTDQSGGEA